MAQSYFPAHVAVPEKHFKVDDVQDAYIEHKDRLVDAIDATKVVLSDIRGFNKGEWVVRYPQLREPPLEDSLAPGPKRRQSVRRSLSFADDPTSETEVVLSSTSIGMSRSLSLASIADVRDEELEVESESERLIPMSDFHVLRLDLKFGRHSAASLVSQLEKSSIANLLDERIGSSIDHIDKLRLRIEDTSSKVLVTGDLNAGKSTFVNALLRREVMPVDQQPCTTAFCEVHDATENQGKEEVHILKEDIPYDINNESSFSRGTIADLEEIVADNESTQQMLKLYLADTRAPSESLLNNGVVDISLIDAPGLNRDSLKTTALFARQEEIDVVVFVVSAENHFTLSAKEFLWNASNEKAFLFIVVNKYDQIKNKEKCRRLVLEQIKQLSPRTYDDADDLVHFVDSAAALQPFTANPAFDDLESSLRSFVLVKRSKSKLQPVSTYLSNLLADIELLASANAIVANFELDRAKEELLLARPVLEKMKSGRDILEENLEAVEEEGASNTSARVHHRLSEALERVGQGKPGVDEALVSMPSYPGLLGIWDYARDIRRALLSSLDVAVKLAEDEARIITSVGVGKITTLGDKHLPAGVERSRRIFMPEAMFNTAKKGTKFSKSKISLANGSGAIVAGGVHGLGIGLAQRSDMLETTIFDVFDVHHQLLMHFGDGKEISDNDDAPSPSALGIISIGVGALTMVGGQAMGVKGVIEGIVHVVDLFGNETARKWAAPVLGAFTISLAAYVILELPSSVPRTVGRRVRASVVANNGVEHDMYVTSNAARISRETRKVLRLASWDLRERFRIAMEERSKEVKNAENTEKRATRAKEWFEKVTGRASDIRVRAGLGSIV